MSNKGQLMGSFEDVQWGVTLDFAVPAAVARVFTLEESWLLPDPKECSVFTELSQHYQRRISAGY